MLTIQVGQCGNQVGTNLFNTLSNETVRSKDFDESIEAKRQFFRETKSKKNIARAILVDTEPKVITEAMSIKHETWCYGKDMSVCEQTGSGNNWAFGSRVHGPALRDRVRKRIRKLSEEMDSVPSFLVLQSVAGGTGSGVGTDITQLIRDEYGSSTIVNAAIWPYESGEVIVQNYNAVLTLSELTQLSDGVMLFENTRIHEMCSKLLNIQRPSFNDLNAAIASQLGGTLFPAMEKSCDLWRSGLDGIAETLCPHPGYRLLTSRFIPQVPERSKAFTVRTWSGLLKHMRQMLIADSVLEEGIDWKVKLGSRGMNKSIATRLTLRGVDAEDVKTKRLFKTPSELYAPWALDSFRSLHSVRPYQGHERSVSMLSNSQSVLSPLSRSLNKAWSMFQTGAYVHQYHDHGVEDGDFVAALIRMEQLLENYRSLSKMK